MAFHPDKSAEYAFQNHIVECLMGHGWLLGSPSKYNRELALYSEDTLAFVKESQPDQWEKYCGIYPNNPEEKFLEKVASQLNKTVSNGEGKEVRTFGTLDGLQHEIKTRVMRCSLFMNSEPKNCRTCG